MAIVTIGGRDFDLAPYKLDGLIAVAPFVDSQKARQREIEQRAGITSAAITSDEDRAARLAAIGEATTMVETMQNLSDAIAILHFGIAKIDPAITIDALIAEVSGDTETITGVMRAVRAVLTSGGLTTGEAKAPAVPAPTGA